jgi:CheY-like chemotaxis protein
MSPGRHDVLVIEDDPGVREGLVDVIAGEGYAVDSCDGGRSALEKLAASRKSGDLPRVIVLDFMMPGVDGWKFLQERARDPVLREIPVVGMSASYVTGRTGMPEGVAAFLRKPFKVEAILDVLHQHLDASVH